MWKDGGHFSGYCFLKCLKVRAFCLNVDARKAERATVNARKPSWSVLYYPTSAEAATDRGKEALNFHGTIDF